MIFLRPIPFDPYTKKIKGPVFFYIFPHIHIIRFTQKSLTLQKLSKVSTSIFPWFSFSSDRTATTRGARTSCKGVLHWVYLFVRLGFKGIWFRVLFGSFLSTRFKLLPSIWYIFSLLLLISYFLITSNIIMSTKHGLNDIYKMVIRMKFTRNHRRNLIL